MFGLLIGSLMFAILWIAAAAYSNLFGTTGGPTSRLVKWFFWFAVVTGSFISFILSQSVLD